MPFDENDPGRLLNIADQLWKRNVDRSLSEIGLTSSQFFIIMSLFENENMKHQKNMSPANLAEAMNCERSTVTGLIDRLEKQEFVIRTSNQEDRRSQNIVLTDKTRKLLDNMEHIFNENKTCALKTLSSQEVKNLQDYLKRIIQNLSER